MASLQLFHTSGKDVFMLSPKIDVSGAKVLVVDDMPANLDVIYKSLRTEGYQVLVATDGETGLKVAEQEKPDLVLLDVMLPGLDGFEVCEKMKADAGMQDIPVIFITAQYDMPDVAKAYQMGAADYVRKPFLKEEIMVRIRTQLENVFLDRALTEEKARRE